MRDTLQRRAWPGLIGVAVLALALLVACGGGGGGSSLSGVGSGGTGASFTSGAVTGFGSVIVGGVHYDETSARIVDDEGRVRSAADLRLGMVTDIDSTFTGPTTAVAQSIKFRSELIGPVSAVDLSSTNPGLTVLGQRVAILPTTVIDVASLPNGLASVRVDDVVEVYGQFDVAMSRLTATRLERHGSVASYKLRGPISSIDTSAETFVIGGQTISYADVASVPSSVLERGRFVRVTLQTTRVGGVWIATALRSGALQLEDRNSVEIEGRISAFISATSFSVNGVAIDASAATVSGDPLALVLGAEVSVKGASSGGVLRAREVEVEDEGATDDERFELSGNITLADPPSQSFVVRGITVVYSGSTRFDDGATPGNLLVGVKVEARGVLSTDGTRLEASRIKIDN
jgi:hypothetical protein